MENNGWIEWKQHILAELKRLGDSHLYHHEKADESFLGLHKGIAKIEAEIATLKTKASFYGAMGGGVLSVAVGVITWLFTK